MPDQHAEMIIMALNNISQELNAHNQILSEQLDLLKKDQARAEKHLSYRGREFEIRESEHKVAEANYEFFKLQNAKAKREIELLELRKAHYNVKPLGDGDGDE